MHRLCLMEKDSHLSKILQGVALQISTHPGSGVWDTGGKANQADPESLGLTPQVPASQV